jgi:PAS domain S-box-containing protein
VQAEQNYRNDAEIASQLLAAIVESSIDAIISVDFRGIITSWNNGAEKLLGYSAAEIVGTSILKVIPDDRQMEENQLLEKIQRGEKVESFETVRLTKNGRLLDIFLSASPIKDQTGKTIGVATISHDITLLKEYERENMRLSRLYSALSQINHIIVNTQKREELFTKICRALVERGGFRMAWIGWLDASARRVVPVGQWGDERGYLTNIVIDFDNAPHELGPTGIAVREGRKYICNDFDNDPCTLPWREQARLAQHRASSTFPIHTGGVVAGALTVYSDEIGFFKDKEVALLEEASNDVSFAIEHLAQEEARHRAEEIMRHERDFSDALLNGLPGIFYLYDENLKFLRWNKNFERVSGYTAAEIALMQPLHFFAEPDRKLVSDRIKEVFDKGFSDVEAGFVSKDGRSTPYYFNGIKIQFDGRDCLLGVGIDITARIEAEKARKASEARYRTLFEYAPDGIVIADAKSTYLDANPSIIRMLGYTRSEFIGLNATDIVVPEEAPHINRALNAIKARSDYHREWRLRRKDGSVCPAEVMATEMPDGNLLGMIRDITERKLAEKQLAESEKKYRELVEYANSIILRWNAEGKITFLNEYGQRFFGYSAEEIVGHHVLDTIVPSTETGGRDLQQLMERICTDPMAFEHNINENVCRDGRRVSIAWTNRIVNDEQGRVVEILSVGTDITERKAAEEKIRQLNSELEQRVRERTAQLETVNKELEAFSYSVSHDLRSPLRAINGLARIVLDNYSAQLAPEGQRYLERIRQGGQRMGQLIDDLLAFSRLSRQAMDRKRINVEKLVQTVLDELSPQREGRDIQIHVGNLPDCDGDPALLKQVWINLISNAIKYTGGRSPARMEIGCQPYQDEIAYFVRDNGAGFDMQFAHKLFKVFQRLHRADEFEGTGVGLAIVQRIIDRHHGRVWAEAKEGQGATFYFTVKGEPKHE